MKYLLDTYVLSEMVKKRPKRGVTAWIETMDETSLYLSVLSCGEIQRGIRKSLHRAIQNDA